MEKYKKETVCPKCGNDEITTLYHESSYSFRGCDCNLVTSNPHMGRHCTRCHYGWAEASLDQDNEN